MKVCIAQTKSIKGAIQKNIENHLMLIAQATKAGADLIVFPELSLSNYEPSLAKDLAISIEDKRLSPFQTLSDQAQISIALGTPTISTKGIQISLIIFQPKQQRISYAKQLLHADEYPYFVAGHEQIFLNIKNQKIAFGICYETFQIEHFKNAIHEGADLYIASVAKAQNGIEKAYQYFPKISAAYQTPILMANAVGPCDNFISAGQSAIWNRTGQRVAQLDAKNQGCLIYNTPNPNIQKEFTPF